MAKLNLRAVDEVIHARRLLHGGSAGAPAKLDDNSREGAALNEAALVMLSSTLQAYVGEVFESCSEAAFGRKLSGSELANYRKTWSRWGNPSPSNVIGLFRRLGVDDVLTGLSWQKQSNPTLRKNLDHINQVRNKIAHGEDLKVDGKAFKLHLVQVVRWRHIMSRFGDRFEAHAKAYFE